MTLPSQRSLSGVVAVAFVLVLTANTSATERHFTYTYESNVLLPGYKELEPWTTFSAGRSHFYTRMDQRLELELGVVKNLQTSLYWNMSSTAEDVTAAGVTTREREVELGSVSNEWKYKLSDSFADALGSALYFEWTASPTEAELETKIILDKRLGDMLIAFNGVAAYGWNFEKHGDTTSELELEADLGFAYLATQNFSVGAEVRELNELEDGDELESATLYAGPVLGYQQEGWWAALGFAPQLAALKGKTSGGLDLMRHERLAVRLLLGVDL